MDGNQTKQLRQPFARFEAAKGSQTLSYLFERDFFDPDLFQPLVRGLSGRGLEVLDHSPKVAIEQVIGDVARDF